MAFRRSALYFAILSMSLVANTSAVTLEAACPEPLPDVVDVTEVDEDDPPPPPPARGTTFSLREDAADAAAVLAVNNLGLLEVLPLLLLIAWALSASFSWHIMLSRREMGVDSGPKKSDMVLERVFRKASFRFSDDLYGGRPARGRPEVDAKADGVEGCWWEDGE